MLNVTGIQEEITALLIKRGASDDVHFLLGIKSAITNDDGSVTEAEIHSITNQECGTCGNLIVAKLCDFLMENIINGTLHVHALPSMYANTEILN